MILEHQAGVRDVFKTLPNVYGEVLCGNSSLLLIAIFAKYSIIDFWQDPKCSSGRLWRRSAVFNFVNNECINPFLSTDAFLYPMKISEDLLLMFTWVKEWDQWHGIG